MPPGTQHLLPSARFALLVLVYLEETGLEPQRFGPSARSKWRGVMPRLRDVDLFELAVRDTVRANPLLLSIFTDPSARNELRALSDLVWNPELKRVQELDLPHMPAEQAYLQCVEALGVDLPPMDAALLRRRTLDRSSLIAEMPNGCGYPSLLLCQAHTVIDPLHNLRIFVDGPEATMLAAWAMLLLTRQLEPPSGCIVPASAPEDIPAQPFDAVLVYRPVPWLAQRKATPEAIIL